MTRFYLHVERLSAPAIVVHGGAGAYLQTTTAEQRQSRGDRLLEIARLGLQSTVEQGVEEGVLQAICAMEVDPRFNAGFGSKLQRDGEVRVSAALMNGARTRLSGIYNALACLHPSRLAAALQKEGDRNLDATGAALLMKRLQMDTWDLRTKQTIARWQDLLQAGDTADAEGAIGDAGVEGLDKARDAELPVPEDLEQLKTSPASGRKSREEAISGARGPDHGTEGDEEVAPSVKAVQRSVNPLERNEQDDDRFGTVGAVAIGPSGDTWACTSTGGRGHEHPGRISDTPTPAGNYACPEVAISATGFGEQILDLNVCGRIATRVIDGMSLENALRRTFEEVADFNGLLGVIAITRDGYAGYAYSTEACGVAWADQRGTVHVDPHGRRG